MLHLYPAKRFLPLLIPTYPPEEGGGPTPPIPTAGLKLWLKGDDIAGSDGDAIASWSDASGNGYNAAQTNPAKQPVLKKGVNGINGHAAAQVVSTSGSADSYLQGTIDLGSPTGVTAIYVVHTSATPTYYPQSLYATVASLGDGGLDLFGCGDAPNFGAGWTDGGLQNGSGEVTGLATNQDRYGIFVCDGSTLTCYGVNSGSNPGVPAFTSGNYRIATGDYGSDQFDGLIAEVIFYNRPLTAPEITQIQSYITTKYGIAP